MLKSLKIGLKELPIPVPLKNLADMISWVEATFVPPQGAITRLQLNGRDVLALSQKQKEATLLNEKSVVELQIDSPRELANQSLEAIHELAIVIEKRFRSLAVACWQAFDTVPLQELEAIVGDLQLTLDLIGHINGILDYSHKELAAINGLQRLIQRPLKALQEAICKGQWQQCAHLLLNRLEPLLRDLSQESENLQLRMMTVLGEEAIPLAQEYR